jgi:hypothetical protein
MAVVLAIGNNRCFGTRGESFFHNCSAAVPALGGGIAPSTATDIKFTDPLTHTLLICSPGPQTSRSPSQLPIMKIDSDPGSAWRPAPDGAKSMCPSSGDIDWMNLFQQTLSFAEYQVSRLHWRGQFGGVLPGGYEPNSIAAQAIMNFFTSQQQEGLDTDQILWEVKRLVLRQVTRLHHLKENWILSNEEELARTFDMDGEPVSPLEFISTTENKPDHALIAIESTTDQHKLRSRFAVFLGKERRLLRLFDLHCDGIAKPQLIASRLKLSLGTIKNLKKRLRHKWLTFSSSQSPAEI